MANLNKEKLDLELESKIENMLDKLIETDEDLENNGEHILKFCEDISSPEEKKDEPFEKDLFDNIFSKNKENKTQFGGNPNNHSLKNLITQQNKMIYNQNIQSNYLNVNSLYKNCNSYNKNYLYSQMNSQNNNSNPSFLILINNNINNNFNCLNNETLITTNSFISNIDYHKVFNNNNQNFNNSFYNEINNNLFKRNKKSHNSFFTGDKFCFNKKFKNQNNNFRNNGLYNSNVEMEILLIEINKILNKIEKIDQIFFNKLKGKFEQIIRTHKGSRIFQNSLKNTHTDILHQIFLEIKNNLPELLKDNYANYFCKKFFDYLSQKDRIEYLSIIQADLNTLAIDITATYPIQGIIEQLGSKAEKKIIYLGLKDYINILCYNIYGTHVIEKILSYFEDDFTKEIIEYISNNFIDLAYNMNGICVVKKLLLMTHKKELHQKLKKIIIENALNLIVHQYGNYVIQVIFENWDDKELEEILNHYKNKFIYLSKLKYSSNVIERIIEKNQNNLEFYINKIYIDNNLSELMLNNYGNYVIQKAIKLSSGNSKDRLVQEIIKNLYIIEDKKIINKWKMIIFSKFSY